MALNEKPFDGKPHGGGSWIKMELLLWASTSMSDVPGDPYNSSP